MLIHFWLIVNLVIYHAAWSSNWYEAEVYWTLQCGDWYKTGQFSWSKRCSTYLLWILQSAMNFIIILQSPQCDYFFYTTIMNLLIGSSLENKQQVWEFTFWSIFAIFVLNFLLVYRWICCQRKWWWQMVYLGKANW